MTCADQTDFMFPMMADIYYPIVEQGSYGNVKKTWVLDRTVTCNVSHAGTAFKEEVKPNVTIVQETLLVGRVKGDIRVSSRDSDNSITNVIVTNIRDSASNEIYKETAGPRKGKSTIFEVATQEPFSGPFGGTEYNKIILRRSENQAVDI